MISVKSQDEIELMRRAGKIVASVIDDLKPLVKAGITTAKIDSLAEELIAAEDAIPAFKGYRGFPATMCTSINAEIVHGIPARNIFLKEGDIISLDLGVNFKGYFSDMAITLAVGAINARAKKLLDVTKKALDEGLKQVRAGNHLSNVSYAIQNFVEKNGFSVVRQFVGHGIGKELHEEPEIPNFGRPNQGPRLAAGMTLAIEPMVNMGTWESVILDNGWTAVTRDGELSAHFEHTVLITEGAPEILTTK